MNLYLKIKNNSLSAEARIIRNQELRLMRRAAKAKAKLKEPVADKLGDLRNAIYLHRIHTVRPEARATHLARGFLRGLAYRQMEQSCWILPNWERVRTLIVNYRPGDTSEQVVRQRFAEWKDAAGDHIKPKVRAKRAADTADKQEYVDEQHDG